MKDALIHRHFIILIGKSILPIAHVVKYSI